MAWSETLQNETRELIYPGAMVKDEKCHFGFYNETAEGKVQIIGVKEDSFIPTPSGEIIATFDNLEEMIAAGWAID
ncbi:MAG: hypothetical protein MJ188_00050 [Treponema sp.]|nr:hypothetical protein [Treponema sp.]